MSSGGARAIPFVRFFVSSLRRPCRNYAGLFGNNNGLTGLMEEDLHFLMDEL